MAVLHTETAMTRLGKPHSTVERGTIGEKSLSYVRFWSWACGCRGELIAGTLIELAGCSLHERAA